MAARGWTAVAAAAVLLVITAAGAAAQTSTLKAGVSVARLTGDGATYWDQSLITQTVGIGMRFRVGPVMLQPEFIYSTRGGSNSAAAEREQMRIDYGEVPLLLWLPVPVQLGGLEPYVFGGPTVALETRCRHLLRESGRRTTISCDPASPPLFSRPTFDFGATGGAGVSHRLGAGTISLEGRHTWGLRKIRDDAAGEAFNRSFSVMVGYTMSPP